MPIFFSGVTQHGCESKGVYCGLHINLQPPHPALELETGIYIVFDYGTSILGQKYRDFEDCSAVEG